MFELNGKHEVQLKQQRFSNLLRDICVSIFDQGK